MELSRSLQFPFRAFTTVSVAEDALAQAQVLRHNLQQLVVAEELQALLQRHLAGAWSDAGPHPRPEARMLVSCFFLQMLTEMSSCLGVIAHHHAGVDRGAGPDEEGALPGH